MTKLEDFDWQRLVKVVKNKKNCDNLKAIKFVEELKKFLLIKFLDNDYDATKYSPSHVIDEVWHLFLLFPRDYSQLCHEVLGGHQILDHNPLGATDREQKKRYQSTISRYEQLFNEPAPPVYWDDGFVPLATANSSRVNKRARIENNESSDLNGSHASSWNIVEAPAPAPAQFTVNVAMLGERTITLIMEPTDTILLLQQRIEEFEGIPLPAQHLYYNKRHHPGQSTLAELNIISGSTFQLWSTPIGPYMQIFYKDLSGGVMTLKVLRTDPVVAVKQLIELIEGIPTDHQRLVFGGRQLEDGRTLTHYRIDQECTIHLMLNLCGC